MTRTTESIGFIGIGAMGWPMARRLVEAGYSVAVCDNDPDRTRRFVTDIGGKAAATPAKAAEGADFLMTMLPNSAIVAEVLTGPEGALRRLPADAVVIEMSSGIPAMTIELGAKIAAAGANMVDAPVSGGVERAETGDIAIMLGGDAGPAARAEPVLAHLGRAVLRTGGLGSGHAMKALNNLVSAGGFLIGVEAMVIGHKFGLDPAMMVDVLNSSTGMNNSTQKKFKQYVLSRGFNSGFRLDLMVKDLTIALGLAEQGDVSAPFAELCREMWKGALDAGIGPDHTAMAQYSERIGGCELS